MFIEENMTVRAVTKDDEVFTGTVIKIVIQPCEEDNNKPYAVIFISQDKKYIDTEGEFGCAALSVNWLKSIEFLEENNLEYKIRLSKKVS